MRVLFCVGVVLCACVLVCVCLCACVRVRVGMRVLACINRPHEATVCTRSFNVGFFLLLPSQVRPSNTFSSPFAAATPMNDGTGAASGTVAAGLSSSNNNSNNLTNGMDAFFDNNQNTPFMQPSVVV